MGANVEELFDLSSFVRYNFTYYNTLIHKREKYRKLNDMYMVLLVLYKVCRDCFFM